MSYHGTTSHTHTRNASGTSQWSASSLGAGTGGSGTGVGFRHPWQQTPRPYTPPGAVSERMGQYSGSWKESPSLHEPGRYSVDGVYGRRSISSNVGLGLDGVDDGFRSSSRLSSYTGGTGSRTPVGEFPSRGTRAVSNNSIVINRSGAGTPVSGLYGNPSSSRLNIGGADSRQHNDTSTAPRGSFQGVHLNSGSLRSNRVRTINQSTTSVLDTSPATNINSGTTTTSTGSTSLSPTTGTATIISDTISPSYVPSSLPTQSTFTTSTRSKTSMDIANRLRGRSDPEKSHAPQNINEARRMWEAKERAKDEEARRKAEKKTEKKASKEEKRGRKSTTSIGSFGGGRRKTDKDGRVTSSMFGDLAAQDRAEQAARESAMNSRDGVPPGQHDYFAMYARERLGGDFAPGAFIDTDSSYHPAINLNDSTAPLGERQGTFSAEGNEKAGRRGSPRTQAAKEKLYQTKQKGKSFWARFWIWLQLRVIKFERKTTREIYERQARDKARKEQIEATERKERERVERLRVERDQRERARAAMAG